jgi:two-component system sensor histidine kinase VicK
MATSEDKQTVLLFEDLTALEEYIHDLFNFSPLPICFISPVGVILEVNPAMERISGYRMDEIVSESVERFFKKEEIDVLAKDTTKNSFVNGRELKFFPKEGTEISVQVFTRVRRDERGEIVGYFLSLFDLSEIKKTEAELKKIQVALLNILEDTEESRKRTGEEKNKTQAIITNLVDGLLFFDENRELVLINPQAQQFLNVSEKTVIGKNITGLKEIPETKSLTELLGEETKPVFRKELSLGKNLAIEVSSLRMEKDGANAGNLVVLHDVTREKIVERLKTEFVSLAAHQLRTPLSAIKWSLKMLLEEDMGKLKREQAEILEKTYQSNERMIALINDLLNVARIEEGRFIINPTSVEMEKICRAVISALEGTFKMRGLELSFIKPKGKISQVAVDEEKMTMAIQNLLDNAMKYTPKGGKVVLSLEETSEGIIVTVKDTGIGIDKEDQNRVFTKFFRAQEAVLTEPAGTGLGLYMVRNIIESHGGRIWFESKPGKGSNFHFILPFQNNVKITS